MALQPSAMPYSWLKIRANGPMPPASMVGQASPYFRFLPTATMQGPASAFPQQMALPAAAAQTAAPPASGTLAQAAAQQLAAQGQQQAIGRAPLALGPGASSAIPMGPAQSVGVAAATNPAAQAAAGARAGVPFFVQGAESAAAASPATQGLLRSAGQNLIAGVKAAGPRGLMRASVPAIVGSIGGNMLDESQLLGGSESAANDSVSKMLKWGGAGAALGSIFPGIGTAIGGAGGAVVGLLHEGAERQGWLGTPSKAEQAQTTIAQADSAAAEIGLPNEITSQLRTAYNAERAFIDPKDQAAQLDLATRYAAAVQESALAYAQDPSAFNAPETSEAAAREAALADQLIMQSVMVNAVKPYADNMLAQSSAEADAYQNMAATAGDLAPMYEQMAGMTRSRGARYATEIVQQAQITPYQQAAEQQAQYLKQIANQTMSSAIGQVMSPQGAAAGSTDLTAIIDQATNQLQPN